MMTTKKIYLGSLTSLALITSNAVYAEQLVTAPTLDGGVFASVGGFYAVTSADNENYGFSGSIDDDFNSVLNVSPGYDLGLDASLGYVFEETANSIEVFYRNHEPSDTDSEEGNIGEDDFGFLDSELGYELNAFDLMMGQFIDIGAHMEMRFTAGLSYVELEQDQHTSFEEFEGEEDVDHFHSKSEFIGWGPRLGIDARYEFGTGIGIVAGGSVAYYIGDLDLHESAASSEVDDDDNFAIANDIDSHSVTNFRGNVALDYVYFFDNESRSALGLEVGYQVDYYADVVGSIGNIEDPDIDTFAVTFSGPYFNLKGAF